MRKTTIAAIVVAAMALTATAVASEGQSDLAGVRSATAGYHQVSDAIEDGFVPFSLDPENPDVPTCFDNAAGGMGVHYVKGIDEVVDANAPEALVYEVAKNGELRLVAVEYIVPEEFVEDEHGNVVNRPTLFGQGFHKHSFLPVYILHAWIWRNNPDGMFADFNPKVSDCPG